MVVERKTLKTIDNQTIALGHYRQGREQAVIPAHGFYSNKGAYLFRNIAGELTGYYDVISFDFPRAG